MAGGGGGKQVEGGPKKARIEIIPLIDVIFFLLATFVLFTLSLDKIASIPVNLPVATPNSTSKPDETMCSIQVSETGTIYWKIGTIGAPELIGPNEVAPRLEDYKTRFPTPRVLIRGDTRAKFGAAVMVLDEVRKAGIEQVSVETVTSTTGR
jgi:biopolymer transport protein ExbD